MPGSVNPLVHKETFLEENRLFRELELNDKTKPIGRFEEIDLAENEIWFLQCPKGMDVTELKDQKLKLPGRTNINNSEALSMEFNDGNEQHAFACCNRKGGYSLRLLPVRGTIILRDRLKAAENITSERAGECCSPVKRVPLPSNIRVRHPLLGSQYEDKINLEKSIVKSLQKADEISAQILKETLSKKIKKCPKSSTKNGKINSKDVSEILPSEISSADEAVEFVSEEKLKRKKRSKRKHSERVSEVNGNDDESISNKKPSKKLKKHDGEVVARELQWLQNL